MKTKENNNLLFCTLVILFVVFFLISIPFFSGDIGNHVIWGRSILNEGAKGFYGREFRDISVPNYPPISMFSFAAAVVLFEWTKNLIVAMNQYPLFPSIFVYWINYENVQISFLKIPAILPFILSGAVIFYFGKMFKESDRQSYINMLFFLLNPAFVYLAVIWGQNDFTQVLFILLAVYFFIKEIFYQMAVFAGFSILSKQTALMIWGLILLVSFRAFGLAKAVGVFLTSVFLIWVFYLPFNKSDWLWPFSFYTETLRTTGLLVSDNAINFWGVLSRFRPADSQEIIFIKLEYWGFLFFAVLFLPVLYKFFKTRFSTERFIYLLFMASIIYFFTLTRMHERYLIFGVVFAQLLAMLNKKYLYNLIFFSLLFFLNLYKGLLIPDMELLRESLSSAGFLSILGITYLIILSFNYYYFMYTLKDEKD